VPARIYELVNITRNEGLAATLVCRSHGDPAPEMTFLKMGNVHEFNDTNVRLILLAYSTDPPAEFLHSMLRFSFRLLQEQYLIVGCRWTPHTRFRI